MFGIYRYSLAVAVVAAHLFGVTPIGWLAVHGFFCLSGFLMTAVMQRDYGYSVNGVKRFAINRILRLMPPYWCVLIMSGVIIWYFKPDNAQSFHERMTLPNGIVDLAANISMIYPRFFPAGYPVQLSPPSWTITIELLFYALIALGISRTRRRTLIWCGLAILYFGVTHVLGLNLRWQYSMLLAGALPFSIGALIYHYKDAAVKRMPFMVSVTACVWLTTALGLNALFCLAFEAETPGVFFYIPFYTNIILSALVILNLEAQTARRWKFLDTFFGDLSYPLYLMHFPVAFMLSMVVLGRAERVFDNQAALLFALTLAVSFIISTLLIYAVDRPIQTLRTKIRQKAKAAINHK